MNLAQSTGKLCLHLEKTMSHRATLYAKELRICPNGELVSKMEKLVLYALADYHQDKMGVYTFPSVERIAEESLMDNRSCRRLLASLECKGVIERQRGEHQGRGHLTFYRFPQLDSHPSKQRPLAGDPVLKADAKGGQAVPLSEQILLSKRGTKGGQKADIIHLPYLEEQEREQEPITPPRPLVREGERAKKDAPDEGATYSTPFERSIDAALEQVAHGITEPVAEPITLHDAKIQLGFGPMQDSDRAAAQILNDRIRGKIVAARKYCENYTSRVLVTQTWLLRLNSFTDTDWSYNWHGYPAIALPKPPFQSVDFLKYVDSAGSVQDLPLDVSYGNSGLQYGYQLARGSETQPAYLYSGWARPWPPVRMVPSNVMVKFRCGYGGPITASMTEGSALLTVTGGAPPRFNYDDAPLMAGDTGLPISVHGAGANGATLETSIASVDAITGQATLADAASTTVASASGWAGKRVPEEFCNAIKLMTEFYYGETQGRLNIDLKEAAEDEIGGYRNFVS